MALVDRAARGHGLPGHYQGAQHEKRQGKDIMAYFGRAVLAIGILLVPIRADAGPADCVSVDNDLDRLACYDREIGRTPSVTVEPTQTAWTVRREKSDFKDTTDVYMTVKSDEPVACGFLGSQQLTLYLRCQENTTAFIIATHCHVTSGHGGYGKVEYRIDDQPAGSQNFTDSTNNRSLGLWNGGASIPLIKKLLGAQTLLVRFTPFSESPVTASFNIAGLDREIAPLRAACKW